MFIARRVGFLAASTLLVAAIVLGTLANSLVESLMQARARTVTLIVARSVAIPLARQDDEEALRSLRVATADRDIVEATLYDRRGTVLLSTTAGLRGSAVPPELLGSVTGDEATVVRHRAKSGPVLEGWAPVRVGDRRVGSVSVAYATTALDRQLWITRSVVALIVVLGVALTVALTLPLADRLARPIIGLAEVSRAVAEGDLSASVQTPGGAADEVVSLAGDLEALVGHLRELIEEAQGVGAELEQAASELLDRANEEASGADEQASSLTQVSTTLEQLGTTTQAIATQAASVAELATTVQQSVESGMGAVHTARDRMEEIRTGSQEAAQQAEELSDASRRIRDVVTIINEIARRTKILAVNAAIEAARAEELGAGFNVVAAEVRQLADSVVDSTRQIEETMGDFTNAIAGIVDVTDLQERRVEEGATHIEEAARVMGEIEHLAQQAAVAAQEISFGAQQQQVGSDQVIVAVREVSEVAQRFAGSSGAGQAAASALTSLTSRLLAVVRRFRLR
jgi:methyl-accepting chemotaxis protein